MSRSPVQRPWIRAKPAPVAGFDDVDIEDWDDLFNAVKDRLKKIAAERARAVQPPVACVDALGSADSGVLECVQALDQLHVALSLERTRRRQVEAELLEAQSGLAKTLAELVDTQAQEMHARHRAEHDPLTSLPNRNCFLQQVEGVLVEAQRQRLQLAVLYLDLDDFKRINDLHGHGVGDEVLRIVAARLARAVRAGDTVGRLGGDEFACLLAKVPNREQLSRLALKLFEVLAEPMKIGQLDLSVTHSIGIAVFPLDGETSESLLKSADAAMYRAKRERRGYAFFDPSPEA